MELPGGSFLMGAAPDEHDAGLRQAYQDVGVDDGDIDEFLARELPRHEVTVGGFRIMATPVTEGLYREIMGGGPRGPEAHPEELPAVELGWEDALDFCNRLSERMGYRRCYRRRFGRWRCDWRADGYRLPTEAEWEYACRAGTSTRYCSGDDPRSVDSYGWHRGNSGGARKEVATRRPNAWGIYDMHGNVWEWCWDEFGPYPGKALSDPRGPSGLNAQWGRVLLPLASL